MSGSSNCSYIKELYQKCDGGVRKYKIKVFEPAKGSGICQYNLKDVKDGDIVEDICGEDECNIDEYNLGKTNFKDTVNCLIESFTTTFAKDFSSGPGDCSSDKLVKQAFKLNVGPEVDLSDCTVNVDQKIDMKSIKVCSNINDTLSKFEGIEKYNFITKILKKVIDKQPQTIRDKTEFINRFSDLMIDSLMAVTQSVNSKCSQSISLSQDQNVYLLGSIKCQGSTFNFSQEAIVDAYMSCITTPVLDNIKNDTLLKKYFEDSADADCVYDLTLIEPCDGETRKVKVNILKPKKGNGKCKYTPNQTISQKCTSNSCEVSEWSEWSPCLIDEKQYRSRRIVLQGSDCPPLYQERDCKYEPIRKRKNANPEVKDRKIINSSLPQFYEFFIKGPSVLSSNQKRIVYAFGIFFIIVLIYSIFF